MTTNAVFAKEFYHQSPFLPGWHVEKMPDGGLRYSTISFGEFWQEKNVQAHVDEQGKINFVTYSFFDRLKHSFFLSPDQNLMAAHRRLKNLETHMQNPLSPDLQQLKQEIHHVGLRGAIQLENNLCDLNGAFEEANRKSLLTTTLIKIVNFIGAFFKWQPVEFYDFSPIQLRLYKEKAISPALELNAQDPSRCTYFPILQNHSPFPLPQQLNRENFQKLELGLLTEIEFTFDQKKFCLWYDDRNKEFVFDYLGIESDPSTSSSQIDYRESFTWSTPVLNLVEKKIGGTTTAHPLQRMIQYSYQETWTGHEWSCTVSGGSLRMNRDSEYTIPLSQGNFCIKLFRRF